MTFLTHIPFRLTAISPIHVGSGEELSWVNSLAHGQALHIFDTTNLDLPRDISRKIRKQSLNCRDEKGLLDLQKLYRANAQIFQEQATDSIALPPALFKEFTNKLGRNVQAGQPRNNQGKRETVLNNLDVARTARNANQKRAVIPGSSLKGAIRTAWLSSLAERHHKQGKKLNEVDILGGSFDTDPFRLFKVDDSLSSQKQATQVFHLSNRKRKSGEEKAGLSIRLEAIMPFAYGEFCGAFRFHNPGDQHETQSPEIIKLIGAVNDYNIHLFDEQAEQLKNISSVDKNWLQNTISLIRQMDQTKCMLVRLGRLGTAESKTVGEELREIYNSQAKKNMKHGTTFWLAGDYRAERQQLPMGWAVIELGNDRSLHLQNYCKALGKNSATSPAQARTAPLPKNPAEAKRWIRQTMGKPAGSKEQFAPQILALLEQAKKWPGDGIYDIIDIVEEYDYGSYQDKINDFLRDY